MNKDVKKRIGQTISYIILIAGACITALPFIWMVLSSFKSALEINMVPPTLIPKEWHWENYVEAFQAAPFGRYFINTLVMTIVSTGASLITTILASYAFARLEFKGKDILFSMFLATMMIPGEMLVITNFLTISKLGWLDTLQALVVPYMANVFNIYLLRQFFMQVPDALYYAAKVDGCGDFKYLWKIMIPLNKNAITTICILNIISCWNAYMWPLLVTNKKENRVLSTGLTTFTSEAGSDYQLIMAASCILVVPIVIFYLILRKQIISGVSRSGIKG